VFIGGVSSSPGRVGLNVHLFNNARDQSAGGRKLMLKENVEDRELKLLTKNQLQ